MSMNQDESTKGHLIKYHNFSICVYKLEESPTHY